METNTILQGDALTKLKELPEKSINCVMTSPPYWALRDYGSEVETIWDDDKNCEHEWIKSKIKKIELQSGNPEFQRPWGEEASGRSSKEWERPSRTEFASRDIKNVCPVCKKEFEGKPNQKFCSTDCLNTLSNEERTNTPQVSNFCQKCGAWKGQLGLEPTFDLYIKHLCDIFDEVKRVLRDDGTIWVNLGDTYMNNSSYSEKGRQGYGNNKIGMINKSDSNVKTKCLTMIPLRFALEMVNRGWILRNTIIWHKPNCMPSSVKDRFTVDFEYVFFFVKNKKYYFETQYEPSIGPESIKGRRKRNPNNDKYVQSGQGSMQNWDREGIKYPNRNKRTVWQICPKPFKESHFAVYPEELCETPIKAGCPEFVCVKCGKAREKIIESIGEIDYSNNSNYEREIPKDNPSSKFNRNSNKKVTTKKINHGLTDCGCNAEFTGGIVLDPFFGAGTTGLVALKQNKKFIGIELNPEYIKIAKERLKPFLEQEKLK